MEGALVGFQIYLPLVHALMLGVFVVLVLVPVLLPPPPDAAGPFDHLAVFANTVLWGLWFPLVLLSVLLTGRSWCGLLCPMGAASEAASRRGLRLAPPQWLTWEGTPVLSFMVVTVLGQTVGVRDHAEAVAEVFGGLMVLAIILGFLYAPGKRPWCRHACPIGLLLGVFARLGAVEFAPKRPVPGGDRLTDRGVCPTMIDIPRKTESRHCIECMRCVSPPAKGGLYLRLRRPGEEIERIAAYHPNPSEITFLFLGAGLALGGFLWTALPLYQRLRDGVGAWFIDHGHYWIGRSGPWWLMSVHPDRREVFVWLDFFMIIAFMLAVMMALALLLLAATLVSAVIAGRFGAKGSLGRRAIELGYQFAPVAMVSLLLGLGGGLFGMLHELGLTGSVVVTIKGLLLAAGTLWSLWLGYRIAEFQGASNMGRLGVLVPGAGGAIAVAAAWWPALF